MSEALEDKDVLRPTGLIVPVGDEARAATELLAPHLVGRIGTSSVRAWPPRGADEGVSLVAAADTASFVLLIVDATGHDDARALLSTLGRRLQPPPRLGPVTVVGVRGGVDHAPLGDACAGVVAVQADGDAAALLASATRAVLAVMHPRPDDLNPIDVRDLQDLFSGHPILRVLSVEGAIEGLAAETARGIGETGRRFTGALFVLHTPADTRRPVDIHDLVKAITTAVGSEDASCLLWCVERAPILRPRLTVLFA